MNDRILGLSALVRLRDEKVWARLALESIIDWVDEIIIVVNCSVDGTMKICLDFQMLHRSKVKVFDYPHEIWPMGPGHDAITATDKRSSAALYNYCQSKSTRTHVVKIDGDMVFMDWAGAEIRRLMDEGHDRIRLEGVDIVGDDLTHIGCHPRCPTNGIYLASRAHYEQGAITQSLKNAGEPTATIEGNSFLHFKWSRKSFAAATIQWPENWREIPHFQKIADRRHPIALYEGEYPASVRELL